MDNNLFIPIGDGLAILSTTEIIYLESESNYTNIYLIDRKLTVLRTLKQFEDKLPEGLFVRIHNKYIINIPQIKTVNKRKPMKITLMNDIELPLAESRKDIFFDCLEKYAIIL